MSSKYGAADADRHFERVEIAKVFQDLREMYGLKPLSEGALKMTVKAWWPFSAERLKKAIDRTAPTSKFYPAISALKESVQALGPSPEANKIVEHMILVHGASTPHWKQQHIDDACEDLGFHPGQYREGEL